MAKLGERTERFVSKDREVRLVQVRPPGESVPIEKEDPKEVKS